MKKYFAVAAASFLLSCGEPFGAPCAAPKPESLVLELANAPVQRGALVSISEGELVYEGDRVLFHYRASGVEYVAEFSVTDHSEGHCVNGD